MILLVEDDLVACHILTALLPRIRQPHVVAHDGAAALAHVARVPVDLIIPDLLLPDMHGFDLAAQILVRPHLRDIPVMVCTAQADAKTVARALSMGAADFVKKPVRVDALAGRVHRALTRADAVGAVARAGQAPARRLAHVPPAARARPGRPRRAGRRAGVREVRPRVRRRRPPGGARHLRAARPRRGAQRGRRADRAAHRPPLDRARAAATSRTCTPRCSSS